MSDEQTVDQVDEQTTESSSSSEPDSSQPAQEEVAAQEGAVEQSQEEQNVPFHEHPRFKELVSEKNTYREQLEQLAAKLEQMELAQRSVPQSPKASDPLIERLKGIDPEFGSRIEQFAALESKIATLEQANQAAAQQQLYTQAMSKLDNLYKSNNVPDEQRDLYQAQIENSVFKAEQQGRQLGVKDLDGIFKDVHTQVSKYMDQYSRKIRESYVTGKKADITPTTQTGGSPVKSGSDNTPNTRDEMKAAVAKAFMEGKTKI